MSVSTFQIEENIRLGSPSSLPFDAVQQAARRAHAHPFIESLPEGYGTKCGAGGCQLSGGQKQRIAIARAIIRNPAILILDEATSALDRKAEKVVQETLDDLVASSGVTTLIVAHRLSTIQKADLIVVLQNDGEGARVVQMGRHSELIQDISGLYYKLCHAQSLETASAGIHKEQPVNCPSATAGSTEEAAVQLQHGDSAVTALQEGVEEGEEDLEEESAGMPVHRLSKEHPGGKPAYTELQPLETSPHRKQEQKNGIMQLSRVLWLALPAWYAYVAMLLVAGLAGTVFPLSGWMLAQFMAVLFGMDPSKMREDVNMWCLRLLLLAFGFATVEFVKQVCKEFVASKVSEALRTKAFYQVLHLHMGYFDRPENSAGRIGSVLSGDVALVTLAATGNILALAQGASSMITGIAIVFLSTWKLSLVVVAAFLLVVPAVAIAAREGKPQMGSESGQSGGAGAKEDIASHLFSEAINSIRVVSACGLEENFLQRYTQALQSQENACILSGAGKAVAWGFSQGFEFFSFSLSMWYGGKLALKGEVKPLDVMSAIFPMIFACNGVGATAMLYADMSKCLSALHRVFGLIDQPSLIDIRDGGEALEDSYSGKVDFKDVSFRYPTRPNHWVYKDLCFTMEAGQSVALVGPSGCGKSTIVQLLLRFYDLENEKTIPGIRKTKSGIYADDKDIRNVAVSSLRASFGLVGQEPVLFDMSIKENIRFSKPDASQVNQLACFHFGVLLRVFSLTLA